MSCTYFFVDICSSHPIVGAYFVQQRFSIKAFHLVILKSNADEVLPADETSRLINSVVHNY